MINLTKQIKQSDELNNLTMAWRRAKAAESEFQQKRLALESEILKLANIDPNISGTHTLQNGLKAVCKKNRKWNQDFIMDRLNLLKSLGIDKRPFTYLFKEDKKKMDALAIYNKAIYDELQEGLAEVTAKPSFSLIDKNKEEK